MQPTQLINGNRIIVQHHFGLPLLIAIVHTTFGNSDVESVESDGDDLFDLMLSRQPFILSTYDLVRIIDLACFGQSGESRYALHVRYVFHHCYLAPLRLNSPMRYVELLEDAMPEPPAMGEQWYFHVTTKPRLKSIVLHGIEPGHKRRWHNMHGGKLGDTKYVYIISDFKEAARWASKVQWQLGAGKEIIILCLKNVPGDIEPDPSLEGALSHRGTWFQVGGTIPPQCIMKIIPLTTDLTRTVIASDTSGASMTFDAASDQAAPEEPQP